MVQRLDKGSFKIRLYIFNKENRHRNSQEYFRENKDMKLKQVAKKFALMTKKEISVTKQ